MPDLGHFAWTSLDYLTQSCQKSSWGPHKRNDNEKITKLMIYDIII